MSQIKEQLLQDPGLRVYFGCRECDEPVEDYIEDASFDGTAEPTSEGIGVAETKLACSECGTEYDLVVVADAGEKRVYISGMPDLQVLFHDNTHDHDDYDEFLAEYEPFEPYEVYSQSVRELSEIDMNAPISGTAKAAFLKMLHLQCVAILEAYLSDRLISVISDDDNKMIALIGSSDALRTKEVKLIEIAKQPDYLKRTTKAFLQRFSFHDLEKVAKFYKAVLHVDLYSSDANKSEMDEVIQKRHHIVHRNGRDNDGRAVFITSLDVSRLKQLISDIVERIELAYVEYRKNKYFDNIDDIIPF
ncbi:hypothetical protein HFO60_04720 [Rhizobium leguminosarum]|uniref:HEPN domain-containing protein n=1 Tax=Rhizobium leguminosarum TaxID=384 RepID=UPI001C969C4A|nr:HEPN domain-containing protein [Rhizobium leguminosarum]MBY5539349.1 hypothetical protein [Rhizobium leguminosarum]MBY5635923.1 hypothetical protein [Rhizobium leguminosarum]